MKSKLIGAGLIAGATWVAYNRLSEPTPFDSPYQTLPRRFSSWVVGSEGSPRRGSWGLDGLGSILFSW